MADLSPAAQAVLDAAVSHPAFATRKRIAAALRAVADYALRSTYASTPSNDWGEGWKEGVCNTAHGLQSIATELESTNA
jgi:hypothetical protein